MIRKAFARNNLNPLIAVTAMDAEVIKTYVKRGLGLGIIPKPAYEAESDGDIVALALDDSKGSKPSFYDFLPARNFFHFGPSAF